MIQGRLLTGPFQNRQKNTTASWRWPLSLLPIGSGTLLVFATSVGQSSVPDAAHSRRRRSCRLRRRVLCARTAWPAIARPGPAADWISRRRFGRMRRTISISGSRWRTASPPGRCRRRRSPQPTPASRKNFLAALSQPLIAVDEARVRREGRSTWRRMNRYEYENTLRDLLDAPWLQIKEMLPEDGLSARFNKVGDALDVSHVQMSRYLDRRRLCPSRSDGETGDAAGDHDHALLCARAALVCRPREIHRFQCRGGAARRFLSSAMRRMFPP